MPGGGLNESEESLLNNVVELSLHGYGGKGASVVLVLLNFRIVNFNGRVLEGIYFQFFTGGTECNVRDIGIRGVGAGSGFPDYRPVDFATVFGEELLTLVSC